MGICELRLMGAVTGDPRLGGKTCRAREAARIGLSLDPDAASQAKELFSIKGPELEAMMDDVDRAAASLDEPNSEAEKNGTAVSSGISGLREWDSKGRMSEYEAYAVLDGQLHLVGPADLGGTRWMMRMSDAEEHFAQLQNARLYIADVQAEYSTTAELNSPLDAAIGNEAPGGGHYLHINDKCPKGICGRLLFCALEL